MQLADLKHRLNQLSGITTITILSQNDDSSGGVSSASGSASSSAHGASQVRLLRRRHDLGHRITSAMSMAWYFMVLGRAYLFENDIEQALINLRAALMRNPADVETRVYLAAAMVAAGDLLAAKWEAAEIRSLEPGFSMRN